MSSRDPLPKMAAKTIFVALVLVTTLLVSSPVVSMAAWAKALICSSTFYFVVCPLHFVVTHLAIYLQRTDAFSRMSGYAIVAVSTSNGSSVDKQICAGMSNHWNGSIPSLSRPQYWVSILPLVRGNILCTSQCRYDLG